MKITAHRSSGPSVEPELLARFVISKCAEGIERNRTELPPIWVALALSAVAHDGEFYNRLKEVIAPSSAAAEEILKMCKDFVMPALGRLQDRESPDDPEGDEEYPSPDERNCRKVLLHALREAKRMLSQGDYEFVNVFEFLLRAGLEPYSFRLCQFEAARESCEGDPEDLIRHGIEIIKAAAFSPREKSYNHLSLPNN